MLRKQNFNIQIDTIYIKYNMSIDMFCSYYCKMKLKATIVESVPVKIGNTPQSVIVKFVGDKERQHFEILFFDIDAYNLKMRKYDVWELTLKLKSKIFSEIKTGNKSYFTTLICTRARQIS